MEIQIKISTGYVLPNIQIKISTGYVLPNILASQFLKNVLIYWAARIYSTQGVNYSNYDIPVCETSANQYLGLSAAIYF